MGKSVGNAKECAIKYLSYKPRTEKEVRDYLIRKKFVLEEIDEAVNVIIKAGFINDIQYVCDYLTYALDRRYGKFKIDMELKKRGVSKFNIEDGFYQFEQLEKVNLEDIQLKNALLERDEVFKKMEAAEDEKELRKSKEKLMRRLSYLGYDGSVISKVVRNC